MYFMFSEPTFSIHISGSMESPNGKEKKSRLNQLEDGIKEQVCIVILVLTILIDIAVIVIVVLIFMIVLILKSSQYSS